ncbi:RNase H domain-containing protein [Trichonephila clavipes]|nr:RNase H domain-containing protein [Trichonephila clavipes]
MVQKRANVDSVLNVTGCYSECCRCSSSQNIKFYSKTVQTMLELFLPTSPKRTMEGVGVISGYPTYENLIAFKCAKALTRKIRHQSQRESWIKALSSAHNTSPGPDGRSYELLRHLKEDSLALLYVEYLQISCEGLDMRMIERQLQTSIVNFVKWCETNGHSISASKSFCVHFCSK